jgi:hypothetical protein
VTLDVARPACSSIRTGRRRHPLRHQVVKIGTHWEGVSVDAVLADVTTVATHVMVSSYGVVTRPTCRLTELRGGKAWIAYRYEGQELGASNATTSTNWYRRAGPGDSVYSMVTRVVSNATYPVKSCPTVSIADRLGCG